MPRGRIVALALVVALPTLSACSSSSVPRVSARATATASPSTAPSPAESQTAPASPRVTASPAVPVLGSPLFLPAPQHGVGWGTPHPASIFNGGDPSGGAFKITWQGWGQPAAVGQGLTSAYRPGGGYYSTPVTIMLRAEQLADCHGHWAYTRLFVREAPRPGAAVSGSWVGWSGAGGNICTSPSPQA